MKMTFLYLFVFMYLSVKHELDAHESNAIIFTIIRKGAFNFCMCCNDLPPALRAADVSKLKICLKLRH